MIAASRITIALFVSLQLSAQSAFAAPPDQQEPSPYTINVRVGLAVLPVTVTDGKNHPVSGLKEENFRVYEDGRPQEISIFEDKDAPVTVGLVVDNSLSMQPKRQAVIAAALAFAESSNPNDEIFVVNFSRTVRMELPLGVPFARNREDLKTSLTMISASGETALYDAVGFALEYLKMGTCDKKYLIVVSDGGDDASKRTLPQILATANASHAAIYSVGIFNENFVGQNPGVLRKLSKATGGKFYLPETVPRVVDTLKSIARDIREQYTLGYVPTNQADDGKFRAVRVTATASGGKKLSVHTRAGYLAPAASGAQAALRESP
jgi:Ca-activated chloride channel family protein